MKKIILISFLLLPILSIAQEERFLGGTKESISKTWNDKKVTSGSTSDDKMTFLMYNVIDNDFIAFYFDKENICQLCIEIFSNNDNLFTAIADLNKRYDKVKPYNWINKRGDIEVTLIRGEKQGFNISFKKL